MSHRLVIALLFLLALGSAGEAGAFGRCTDVGYLSSFDPALGTASCRTLHTTAIHWRGGEAPLRVIAYGPTPALDEGDAERELVARIDELVRRAGPAMDALGGLELGEVTVLLSDLSHPRLHAGTFTRSNECKIIFYKTRRAVTRDEFLFTYSHELFHCIQGKTWPGLDDGAAALWWMEGTAEYFAHLTNPGSHEGDRFLSQFDQESPDQSLLTMEYPAVVYFLWLGQTREPRGVRAFIDHMATAPGREAQFAALSGRAPMDDWIAFGQDYLDGRIRLPGGRTPDWLVDQGDGTTITGPASHGFLGSEYVLSREHLLFKQGRSYPVRLGRLVGEARSRAKAGADAWADPPERVQACDQDVSVLVLTAAVQGENVSVEWVVEDSGRVDERACCLIGDWEPTPASRDAELELAMGVAAAPIALEGAEFGCALNGGGWTLHFGEDGKGRVAWDGFSYKCTVTAPTGSMSNIMTRRGNTEFDWNVVERGVGTAHYTGNSLAWHHTMLMGPVEKSRVMADAGPSTGSNNFAFQCTATTLSVQGLYGLNHGQATYTRVGAPPARP